MDKFFVSFDELKSSTNYHPQRDFVTPGKMKVENGASNRRIAMEGSEGGSQSQVRARANKEKVEGREKDGKASKEVKGKVLEYRPSEDFASSRRTIPRVVVDPLVWRDYLKHNQEHLEIYSQVMAAKVQQAKADLSQVSGKWKAVQKRSERRVKEKNNFFLELVPKFIVQKFVRKKTDETSFAQLSSNFLPPGTELATTPVPASGPQHQPGQMPGSPKSPGSTKVEGNRPSVLHVQFASGANQHESGNRGAGVVGTDERQGDTPHEQREERKVTGGERTEETSRFESPSKWNLNQPPLPAGLAQAAQNQIHGNKQAANKTVIRHLSQFNQQVVPGLIPMLKNKTNPTNLDRPCAREGFLLLVVKSGLIASELVLFGGIGSDMVNTIDSYNLSRL